MYLCVNKFLHMKVTLTLTVDETGRILDALSQLPFREVAGLIQKIIEQGDSHVSSTKEGAKMVVEKPSPELEGVTKKNTEG